MCSFIRAAGLLAIAAAVSGCANLEGGDLFHARLISIDRPESGQAVDRELVVVDGSDIIIDPVADAQSRPVVRWEVPVLASPPEGSGGGTVGRPSLKGAPINVTLPAQSVASFVDTVLGDVLELPYGLGPGVAEREEIVTLRSVRDMRPETFFQLFEAAIAEFGLAIVYSDGLIMVVDRAMLQAETPQFIRSRERQGGSASPRPVAQFVQLQAMDAAEMEAILRISFPDKKQLGIQTRRDIGALTLSGLSDDVDAALVIIGQMDDLRFSGSEAVILSPRNWEAQALAGTVRDILSVEGYQVSVGAGAARPITLLAVQKTNQILIFSDSKASMAHVVETAQRLDAAAEDSEERQPHIYQVRARDAQSLATIASGVLGEEARKPQDGAPAPPPGRLTVDEMGNRIIFNGTLKEFRVLEKLLSALDTAAPEVLIEVTIAEVTLSDDERFGSEFLLNTFGGNLELRTVEGLGLEAGGLSGVLRSGDLTLNAAAFMSQSRINILSTPRIVTRSGSSASVQVGTDVPIVTSQRAANTQQTGSTDILQTIQFRSTGVLLSVEPRVYSDDRIDLVISQEVSAAQPNPNQAIASPIISNRSLTSELTLQDGQTAVLGGLMERRQNRGSTGVPGLSRIPLLGSLFSTESYNSDQTVLLVLVTPYILRNREDRQRIVDFYGKEANLAFAIPIRSSDTELEPATMIKGPVPVQSQQD